MKLGFCSVLTLIFVIFKLMGMLDMTWLWVFSPIWIGYSLILAVTFLIAVVAFAMSFINSKEK